MVSKFCTIGALLILITLSEKSLSQVSTSSSYNANPVNIYGVNNCGFGYFSLLGTASSSGPFNTALGYYVLNLNEAGENNTAAGASAMQFNLNGNGNVAFGFSTLKNNSSVFALSGGDYNTAFGSSVLMHNTIGNYNTGIGSGALFYNTSGSNNTAVGFEALRFNSFGGFGGNDNTSVGYRSLFLNLSGSNNTAQGFQALYSNTSGDENTAFGYKSLFSNCNGPGNVGSSNTAMGYMALYSNDAGDGNTAIGVESMKLNQGGLHCTAVGYQSLFSNNNGGDYNVGIGYKANYMNTSGLGNVAVGAHALYANNNYSACTAIGTAVLYNNFGDNNVAFGANAGLINAPKSNITLLGSYSDLTGSFNNATAIGYMALAKSSNSIWLGNNAVSLIRSNAGIYQSSDGRFKREIKDDVVGLEFILRLKPVTYNFDAKKFTEFTTRHLPDSIREKHLALDYSHVYAIKQSGFIAQEVYAAAKESNYDFNGVSVPAETKEHYSLNYNLFVVPLVKALQEQQQIIIEQTNVLSKIQLDIKREDERLLLNEFVSTMVGSILDDSLITDCLNDEFRNNCKLDSLNIFHLLRKEIIKKYENLEIFLMEDSGRLIQSYFYETNSFKMELNKSPNANNTKVYFLLRSNGVVVGLDCLMHK